MLALSGISGASAAGRMVTAHAEHAVTGLQDHPVGAGDQAMPPCHGNAADAMPAAPVEQSAPLEDLEQCCDSSACQCAWVHHYAATIVAGFFTAALLPETGITRALDVSHRAPALPHLIRPPIG
ncbi:MAG: CopL family metal-binding regulatory protein [Lysobacter sp.]